MYIYVISIKFHYFFYCFYITTPEGTTKALWRMHKHGRGLPCQHPLVPHSLWSTFVKTLSENRQEELIFQGISVSPFWKRYIFPCVKQSVKKNIQI